MSAIPIQSSPAEDPTKAPPAPRGVGFIALREASYRSGIPMETLAAKCRREWAAQNMAAILKPDDGGKPCWHVREDADGLFARIKSPSALPFDWQGLTDNQRGAVRQRKRILDSWMNARGELLDAGLSEREATAAYLRGMESEQGGGVSRGSLFRWMKSYRAAGLAGLIDKRMERSGALEGEEFIEELKRLYLDPRQKKAALCYAMASEKAEERGWVIPFGEERARQILKSLDPKLVAYHREGPRAYDGRHGKYIPRDYSQMESNELWVSDGHKFNVFVEYRGKLVRPILTSWMDVRSRFAVGWTITGAAESSDTILTAFRSGVKACGLPVGAYHDNGKGYDARAIQGVTKGQRRRGERPYVDPGIFQRLEVRVRHAKPYNAKAKLIERWHRTLDERFSRRFETYCGADTAHKPFDLETQKAKGKAPLLEEFISAFRAWLTADYHNRAHDGLDGQTPAQVYCANLKQKRMIPDETLDLELCRRELVKVGRNGITLRGIIYEAPELDVRTGEELQALIDTGDVSRVKVLDTAGRFVCAATSIRQVPANANADELREAMAGISRDRKRVKAARPAIMRMADDPIERLERIAAEKIKAQPQPAPERVKPFRSKLEADAAAIQAAQQCRATAAGEHSLADLFGEREAVG